MMSRDHQIPDHEIDWATGSHRGRIREQNEDSVRLAERKDLAVLCDGMGGHRAGEVASRLAVETFLDAWDESGTETLGTGEHPPEVARLLFSTRRANEAVLAEARRVEAYRGMGCTLVALLLNSTGVSFVSVGDSRLYLLRRGILTQITEDHTRVRMLERMGIPLDPAEARQMHGLLVRALGTHSSVEIDHGHGPIYRGDVWLLCSDGLTDELGDAEIGRVLRENPNARAAAQRLIERAVQAGGRDNVSVAVARVLTGSEAPAESHTPRPETEPTEDDESAPEET